MTITDDHTTTAPTGSGPLPIPGVDARGVYVLPRDQGDHHHFLNHLATRKVTAGEHGSMCAVEFVAPRDFGPPLHRHERDDEVMIVLEGDVACLVDGVETIAGPGASVFLPHGVPHTFQVVSDEARFYTVASSRGGASDFDRFVAELGEWTATAELPEPGPIDPGHVAAVCAKYGIEVLGPPPAPRG